MELYRIIDADAHMSEPFDLWTERIDRRFRDQAPRLVRDYNGKSGSFFVFEDFVTRFSSEREGASKDMQRPGGWNPAERLKDMELEGVDATVLYTTYGFTLFACQNPELQAACFRVYNDWLAEFCSYAPEQLAGVAMISLYDVERGRKELEHASKIGLRGAMIWSTPPDTQPPYYSSIYDPFWAAVQELGMPLSLHLNTGGRKSSAYTVTGENHLGQVYTKMVMAQHEVQESILSLIFGGVLERFPNLKLVSAEGDIAWLPHLIARADKYFASRTRRGHSLSLPMPPSEYFRRQVWATFIKDPLGLQIYKYGDCVDRIMWSTDYPHPASFFPHSQNILRGDFACVSEEDKRKIVYDNAARLYGFRNESSRDLTAGERVD
jgi:predicted TIM-barrel fold metal-dependent hydrolase